MKEHASIRGSIAVLASGRGSNFQALLDRIGDKTLPIRCVRLITDNPGAYAIQRAESAGVLVSVIPYGDFSSREEYEQALARVMAETGADLFVLAGYMRILGSGIIRKFPGRIINIHPALLPSFPGLHAQRQALAHGVKVAGCTVHFVTEEMDAGPIIIQHCVPVLDADDEDTLAERILIEEHICLPEAVRLFCEGRLRLEGRKVLLT